MTNREDSGALRQFSEQRVVQRFTNAISLCLRDNDEFYEGERVFEPFVDVFRAKYSFHLLVPPLSGLVDVPVSEPNRCALLPCCATAEARLPGVAR